MLKVLSGTFFVSSALARLFSRTLRRGNMEVRSGTARLVRSIRINDGEVVVTDRIRHPGPGRIEEIATEPSAILRFSPSARLFLEADLLPAAEGTILAELRGRLNSDGEAVLLTTVTLDGEKATTLRKVVPP